MSALEMRIVEASQARRKRFPAHGAFCQQEIEMKASLTTLMALGFILALPLLALPAFGAPEREAAHRHTHHHVADFAKARALVSPAAPGAEGHQTDGLSRDGEDCSRGGCIDH
jgi:hypothetical protein